MTGKPQTRSRARALQAPKIATKKISVPKPKRAPRKKAKVENDSDQDTVVNVEIDNTSQIDPEDLLSNLYQKNSAAVKSDDNSEVLNTKTAVASIIASATNSGPNSAGKAKLNISATVELSLVDSKLADLKRARDTTSKGDLKRKVKSEIDTDKETDKEENSAKKPLDNEESDIENKIKSPKPTPKSAYSKIIRPRTPVQYFKSDSISDDSDFVPSSALKSSKNSSSEFLNIDGSYLSGTLDSDLEVELKPAKLTKTAKNTRSRVKVETDKQTTKLSKSSLASKQKKKNVKIDPPSDTSDDSLFEPDDSLSEPELEEEIITLEKVYQEEFDLAINEPEETISFPAKTKEVKKRKPRAPKDPKNNLPPLVKRRVRIKEALSRLHPVIHGVWEKLAETKDLEPVRAKQPESIKMPLLPFQLEGLTWLIEQENSPIKGGILADEMGMGKTIQTVSLIASSYQKGPTLVVLPTVSLLQWKKEINMYAPELSVGVHHGTHKIKTEKEILAFNVLLTTYAVLEASFRKQNYGFRRKGQMVKAKSLIHSINWYRVVLDEAHCIKDSSTGTCRAACMLKTENRWCLSGTPLQNRIGELFSLIKFLKVTPFCMYFCSVCECRSTEWKFGFNEYRCRDCNHSASQHVNWWNFEILKPIQQFGGSEIGIEGYNKLKLLISYIMLRRTKIERASDLGLPPKLVVTRRDLFSPDELDFYNSLFSDTKRQFATYASHGTILNNYANIFELITKMRLAVNHPDLLVAKLNSGKSDQLVCSLCHTEPEDPIASKCKHIFCRLCVSQYLEISMTESTQCPDCFLPLTIDLTQPTLLDLGNGTVGVANPQDAEDAEDTMMTTPKTTLYRRSIVNRIDMTKWRSSTKIEALVEELENLRRDDANIKSIVFSQYVSFLDLVQWRLNRAGFSICRLDGRMTPQQRDAVINTFMTKPQYTVFLVSLKAGGVALNLTEASQVFICDPWWNPAVEDQAMDRIHRLGQRRPIRTTKLIVENSIESRIVEIQDRKRDLFTSTIGKDSEALSRLTEEDMEFLFKQ